MKRLSMILLVLVISTVPSLVFAAPAAELETAGPKPTITVMVNSGAAASHRPASNDLLAYQVREEKSGIHVEWDVVETANFNEVVGARLASGMDLPDVMNLPGALFERARTGGLLQPLDDLIEQYAPNLVKWFAKEENEIYKVAWTSPDGHLYGINNKVIPNHLTQNIMFNKLWLDRLNLQTPTTTDEFVQVLKKFRDEDANGNGKPDDEIPLVTDIEGLHFLGNPFGLRLLYYRPYDFDDGVVTWNYADPRYKELLKYCNMLWQEGLLDKELTTMSSNKKLERAANDVAGSIYYWGTWAYRFSQTHPQGDPAGLTPIFIITEPLEGPRGDKYFERRVIPGGGGLTISATTEVPEVAMKWIDFVYASEDGFNVYAWGVEGVTYKVVNGEKEKIIPEDGVSWNDANLRIGAGQPPWAHEQSLLAWKATYPAWMFDYDEKNQKYYIDPFPPIANTQDELDVINELSTDIETYKREMRNKFILGQADIDAEWDNYLKNLERMGYKRIEAVYQQMYDRYVSMSKK